MKRYLCSAVLAFTLGGLMIRSSAAERVTAENLRENLFSTCFSSPTEGWAVGDLGKIFHTTDAGKSWDIQDAGTKRPFAAITCHGSELWAVGQGGQIAHSADGGKTWKAQKSGVERQLLDVAFATPQLGLAVGDFGVILRTTDGGQTWNRISLPEGVILPEEVADVVAPGDFIVYGTSFASPDHAWIAGEFGLIFSSNDGGITWQQQTSTVETTIFGIGFADPQHGWAVGIDAVLLSTEDGGTTWTRQHVETPKGFTLPLYDVAVNGNYGWAIGNSGFLLQTKDGGKTWRLSDVPVKMAGSWFRGVSMLPDGRGFMVGARGLVLSADRDQFTALKSVY